MLSSVSTICLASDIDWLLEVGHSRPIKETVLIATVDWHHALKFHWLLMVASMCQVTAGGVLWVSQLSLANVVHVRHIDIDLRSYHFKGTCLKYAAHPLEISGWSTHWIIAVDLMNVQPYQRAFTRPFLPTRKLSVLFCTIEDWKAWLRNTLHCILPANLWQAVFFKCQCICSMKFCINYELVQGVFASLLPDYCLMLFDVPLFITCFWYMFVDVNFEG